MSKKNQTPLFTLEEIKAAHAKVKSGADFPAYISEIKQLGVIVYEHYLEDGHIVYYGKNDFKQEGPAKWQKRKIANLSDGDAFKEQLLAHQAGQSDYLTICMQASESGVEKWVVDLGAMTCIYYDKAGKQMLMEIIPDM